MAVPLSFSKSTRLQSLAFSLLLLLWGNVAIADTPQGEVYERETPRIDDNVRRSDLKDYNICMNGEGTTIILYDGYRLEIRKGQCAKIRAANVRVIPPEKQSKTNQSTGGLRYNEYTYPNAKNRGGLSTPRKSERR